MSDVFNQIHAEMQKQAPMPALSSDGDVFSQIHAEYSKPSAAQAQAIQPPPQANVPLTAEDLYRQQLGTNPEGMPSTPSEALKAASIIGPGMLGGPVTGPVAAGVSALGGYGGEQVAKHFGFGPTGQAVGGVVGGILGGLTGAQAVSLPKYIAASKTVGGRLLGLARQVAGDAPVPLSGRTNTVIEQITSQGERGGTVPKVVTDLLKRLGPSERQPAEAQIGPLTYEEARDFQGNLSTMSVDEMNKLKGKLKYLIPQLANSFSKDVQTAADRAGIGQAHATGMREYALAAARNRALLKAATTAGVGIGGWELLQKLGVKVP